MFFAFSSPIFIFLLCFSCCIRDMFFPFSLKVVVTGFNVALFDLLFQDLVIFLFLIGIERAPFGLLLIRSCNFSFLIGIGWAHRCSHFFPHFLSSSLNNPFFHFLSVYTFIHKYLLEGNTVCYHSSI